MQQRIQNKQPGLLTGILLVIGIAAFFIVLNLVSTAVQLYVNGTLGFLLFWGLGAAAVWLLLSQVVMAYQYTWNGMVLRVERVYGKRARYAGDIALRHLTGMGTLEEMKRRFPGAKVTKALRRQCPLEPLAVAFRDADNVQRIFVIQPNDELREKLDEAMKG